MKKTTIKQPKKNLFRRKKENQSFLFSLAIHGGAGNQTGETVASSIKREKEKALMQALKAGYEVLEKKGSSLDAVQAAVIVLEDSEFFNAGKGAVLTKDKTVELDASIMSSDSRAGAVGGVKETKNPILLARYVMEQTPYVFLIGEKADQLASQQGLEKVPNTYFITRKRLHAWQQAAKSEKKQMKEAIVEKLELGTVGAVALDQAGSLAAATSTGGLNYKMAGRVGDSAVIGAGTYANKYCAVSCTGKGEFFIRQSIASFVCQAIRLGIPLEEAAFCGIFERVSSIGGEGGLIAIDHLGRCAMPYNTLSMSRGYWHAGGAPMIYLD